jgi:hypothetical protein
MLTVHVMCGWSSLFCNDRGDATLDGRLLDFKYSTTSDMSTTFLFGRNDVTFRPSARGINDH